MIVDALDVPGSAAERGQARENKVPDLPAQQRERAGRPAEREAFQRLLNLGLKDSFRLFPQPEKSFSWWDYRRLGFQKNQGLRIDHILLSTALAERCNAAGIDRAQRKNERPSDHAPVTANVALCSESRI